MVLKGNLLVECNTYFHRNFYITSLRVLPDSRVWHELLTLGFVKVTRGYVT